MKLCKKCKQSFFDGVMECACGSKKFIFTEPPIEMPAKDFKKNEDDDDLNTQTELSQEKELAYKKIINNLMKPISTPSTTGRRITQPFRIVNTINRNPITPRNTSLYRINPLTNNPMEMAFPLSKSEADQLQANHLRELSFNQFKRDQLLKRHKEESKDDE